MAAARLEPLGFEALAGWAEDDHRAALLAFAAHAAAPSPTTGSLGIDGRRVASLARGAGTVAAEADAATARRFFETRFRAAAVAGEPAFLTGYYEPEVAGSRRPTPPFRVPLLAPPADLVALDDRRPADLDARLSHGRVRTDGRLVECADRAAIEDGALRDERLELAWVEDPIDAFFIHVQGSARICLAGGGTLRVAYAGKSGHPYTSIGRLLVERGAVPASAMTADRLRQWLAENRRDGAALMRENRSYVFFREEADLDPALGPRAAAGVQLTGGRSLAVDRRMHTYGTPVWLEAQLPLAAAGGLSHDQRLTVAQDTGSAIVGAARGDLFCGMGSEAGRIAGRIRHTADRFVVLVPRDT